MESVPKSIRGEEGTDQRVGGLVWLVFARGNKGRKRKAGIGHERVSHHGPLSPVSWNWDVFATPPPQFLDPCRCCCCSQRGQPGPRRTKKPGEMKKAAEKTCLCGSLWRAVLDAAVLQFDGWSEEEGWGWRNKTGRRLILGAFLLFDSVGVCLDSDLSGRDKLRLLSLGGVLFGSRTCFFLSPGGLTVIVSCICGGGGGACWN